MTVAASPVSLVPVQQVSTSPPAVVFNLQASEAIAAPVVIEAPAEPEIVIAEFGGLIILTISQLI